MFAFTSFSISGLSENAVAEAQSQLARLQQPDHPILNHFRVRGQPLKRTFLQPEQDRIRNVPHARLQRQQILRHPPFLHFPAQKLQNVPGNSLRSLIRRLERTISIGRIRQHDPTILSAGMLRYGVPIRCPVLDHGMGLRFGGGSSP